MHSKNYAQLMASWLIKQENKYNYFVITIDSSFSIYKFNKSLFKLVSISREDMEDGIKCKCAIWINTKIINKLSESNIWEIFLP